MQDEGVLTLPDSRVGHAPRARSRRPELTVLTSLRAFAALEVVLLHVLFELGGKPMRMLPNPLVLLLTNGGLAVSFFFVLSGFILAYTYSDEAGALAASRSGFWRARFARIYPLYFLGFVLDAPRAISYFLGAAASLAGGLGKIAVAASAYLLLIQSWYPRVSNAWNTPGWSLSTEAFFYAVFPWLLALSRRWSLSRFAALTLVLWAVPNMTYCVVHHAHVLDLDRPVVYTLWRSLPPLRLSEFMLGVVAGRAYLAGRVARRMMPLRCAGVVAASLCVLLPFGQGLLPKAVLENSLAGPLFAIVILALATKAIPTPRWLTSAPLPLLGRASYAVYIIHQPLKPIVLGLLGLVGLATPSPLLLLAFLTLTEAACIGLFVWFEDPLRRWITRGGTASALNP